MLESQGINWFIYIALLLYVALDAAGQGKFADLTREAVAPAKQAAVNRVLHWLYPAKYVVVAGLVAGLVWYFHGPGWWRWLLVAPLLRLACFDVVLTWSRKDKLWSLGTSSQWDRLLSRVPWLNPILRVVALGGSVALLVV